MDEEGKRKITINNSEYQVCLQDAFAICVRRMYNLHMHYLRKFS